VEAALTEAAQAADGRLAVDSRPAEREECSRQAGREAAPRQAAWVRARLEVRYET